MRYIIAIILLAFSLSSCFAADTAATSSKEISISYYSITTTATQPLAPATPTTFTLINNNTGTPIPATTWQYRKQGDTVWKAAGTNSPTVTISFTDANGATPYEVQAIRDGIPVTTLVNVDPLLFVLNVGAITTGTLTNFDLTTAGGATTAAKVQTWLKWGYNNTTSTVQKTGGIAITATSVIGFTTVVASPSVFTWSGDGNPTPTALAGNTETKFAASVGDCHSEANALVLNIPAPTTTTRHVVIIFYNTNNGGRTANVKAVLQGTSATTPAVSTPAQSNGKVEVTFRASDAGQTANIKIWQSQNYSSFGIAAVSIYDE